MRARDQYHVGIVVDDLDAALDELGRVLGHEFGPEVDVEQRVHLPGGDQTVRFRFRFSRTEPRVEVIQAQPGTLWVPAAGGAGHHLGFWSDDVAADGAALAQAGYTFEAAGTDESGNPRWAYHRSAGGLRIELVDRAMEDLLSGLWR
jgi:catechol 2,3-dioxygenase-like lactoylglutathione lyase family enzyme